MIINKDKTEEFTIQRDGDEKWKTCKILGSLLDTEKDIERRKALTLNVFNKFKYTLQSKRISKSIKIRIFVAYIQCVFLYNSELWTVTKSIEHKIDVFQRNILRKILGYNWIKGLQMKVYMKRPNLKLSV